MKHIISSGGMMKTEICTILILTNDEGLETYESTEQLILSYQFKFLLLCYIAIIIHIENSSALSSALFD